MEKKQVVDYLHTIIAEFSTIVPQNDSSWNDVIFREGTVTATTRPDLYSNIVWGQPRMPALKEFAGLLEADSEFMSLSKEIAKKTDRDLNWIRPYDIAIHLLEQYLLQVNQISYNRSVAEQIAKNFVSYVKTRSSTLTFFSVIRGLEIDVAEVELWDNVRLKRVTDQEASWLVRNFPSLQTKDHFPSNNVLVEHTMQYELGLYDVHEPQKVLSLFDQIILALLLLKGQTVNRENTFEFFSSSGELGRNIDIHPSHGLATRRSARLRSYQLSKSDLPELKRIIENVFNRENHSQLELAIRRFQYASGKEKFENDDKLLDLYMALEALYDTVQGASSYSIRMRAAKLLEDNLESRRETIKIIVNGYNTRSKIVHGRQFNKNKTKLKLFDELVTQVYQITRRSILAIMEFNRENEKMMSSSDFDELLLG